MKTQALQGNIAFLLQILTSYFPHVAYIFEFIYNALDEQDRMSKDGTANQSCHVVCQIEEERITIEHNVRGMDANEFEEVLSRIGQSSKIHWPFKNHGGAGLGLFAFLNLGSRCTVYSKKHQDGPTVKVTLTGGSNTYQIEAATESELGKSPGMKTIIDGLLIDTSKAGNGFLTGELQKSLGKEYARYLQEGTLSIEIRRDGVRHNVEPPTKPTLVYLPGCKKIARFFLNPVAHHVGRRLLKLYRSVQEAD